MNTRTQKMLIALAGTLSATALLTACGEELDQLTNADLNTVASFKDLGDCNSKNKGRMVYVDSSDAIYFCADSVWKEVNLSEVKGSDGKDGANGKDGKNGADGKDGKDGTSCTVEALKDGSGYDVLCGGKKVGTLLNGKDGAKGADGKNGTNGSNGSNGKSAYEIAKENGFKGTEAEWLASLAGAQGSSCSIKVNEQKNGYDLTCGDKTVTITNGKDGESVTGPAGESCSTKSVEGGVEITCGKSEPVVIKDGSNGKDASDDACRVVGDKAGVVTLECGKGENVQIEKFYKATCNNEPFDPETHFCYFNEKEGVFSVLELCGGKAYNPSDVICEDGKRLKSCPSECNSEDCEDRLYDMDAQFCYAKVVYDLCDGKDYNPMKFECVENELQKYTCGESEYDLETQFCAKRGDVVERVYKKVKIGKQIWMAENLNYEIEDSWCGGNRKSGDFDGGDCDTYGRLYTWATAMGKPENECGSNHDCDLGTGYVQGICPDGWHVPSDVEWDTLIDAVGGISTAGQKLKAQTLWKAVDGIENEDAYGFSALPAGFKYVNFAFTTDGNHAGFWGAKQWDENRSYGYTRTMKSSSNSVNNGGYFQKDYAYSIRCLQD